MAPAVEMINKYNKYPHATSIPRGLIMKTDAINTRTITRMTIPHPAPFHMTGSGVRKLSMPMHLPTSCPENLANPPGNFFLFDFLKESDFMWFNLQKIPACRGLC